MVEPADPRVSIRLSPGAHRQPLLCTAHLRTNCLCIYSMGCCWVAGFGWTWPSTQSATCPQGLIHSVSCHTCPPQAHQGVWLCCPCVLLPDAQDWCAYASDLSQQCSASASTAETSSPCASRTLRCLSLYCQQTVPQAALLHLSSAAGPVAAAASSRSGGCWPIQTRVTKTWSSQ